VYAERANSVVFYVTHGSFIYSPGIVTKVKVKVKVKVTLRPTVSQYVLVSSQSGTFDHRFFFSKCTVLSLWGALSVFVNIVDSSHSAFTLQVKVKVTRVLLPTVTGTNFLSLYDLIEDTASNISYIFVYFVV
jgi:hypothetical protein